MASAARLEDVLQGGEVALEFTAYGALDERLGQLEETARLALDDDADARSLAGGLDGLLDVERHRAGSHLEREAPRRFVLLDPYRRLHPAAEELAHFPAGDASLQLPVDAGLERARLPLRHVGGIGRIS